LHNVWLAARIRRVHAAANDIYGQLKVWDELNEEGIRVPRCTVERLVRRGGICGVGNGKVQRTTLAGSNPIPAPDLLRRDFSATRPDAVWLADFT
jgi:putative transposase